MEFGERMLKKYGWESNSGLGKDNQGMKTALKPVLKFDTRGVGCNQKDEYSSEFKWWEHNYNRAAKKISGSSTNEEKSETKKRKEREEEKSMYTRFEKGSILTGNKEESLRVDTEQETVVNEVVVPSDEELLRICGGRTAHKGARHGIKMSGKLQRLEEQEKLSSSSLNNDTNFDNEKSKKKKKK